MDLLYFHHCQNIPVKMKYVAIAILLINLFKSNSAVRPAFQNSTELCTFTNRAKINGMPAEMTTAIDGMKYFHRIPESRDKVTADKATSYCKLYNLEAAEILDQDDYNEIITIVKETGWSFWIAIKGKYAPEYGNYNFDFKLADGQTKIGFHDFGPRSYDTSDVGSFRALQEGCVSVIPNPTHPSGVSWSKERCNYQHDILCQYKKSCYKRTDYMKDPTRPVKRLAPLILAGEEETGYYISTMQASWPYAKQVCEDSGMSLLWLDDEVEHDAFMQRLTTFTGDKANYNGKSFWTAGRFSPISPDGDIYSKLYWWVGSNAHEVRDWDVTAAQSGQAENSGGFTKKWGIDQEAIQLKKNEPNDEGGSRSERCVDIALNPECHFYTSKCTAHLRHFICKNSEVVRNTLNLVDAPKPSSVEYCEGLTYRKSSEKDCNGEVLFAGEAKPDCTCYNGVHGLMADIKCKPRLLVGTGCTKLKAKSSLHWKILPSLTVHSNRSWIVGARSSDDHNGVYEWFTADTEQSASRQVVGSATIFFYGFKLYRDEEGETNDLCLVPGTLDSQYFYEYEVSDLKSFTLRYYTYEHNCYRDDVPQDTLKIHLIENEKRPLANRLDECELACAKGEPESSSEPSIVPNPSHLCNDISNNCASTESDVHPDDGIATPGKAPGDVEDVNNNINRQLLIYAVEMAFQHFAGPTDSIMTGPRNTWIILEKLFELAKQACHKLVAPNFFSRVLKYFKIAHFGENFEYDEHFSELELKQIVSMLDSCQERAYRYREMDVDVDNCTGRASRVTLENMTNEIISRSSDDTGYQTVFHHHIMEATWNVIDLWNAVCINEFKSSYLLYHHMENGLEMLFNDKLKKLWHFPNVTEGYFQKLLGPDEGIQLLNLDQCVSAAYKGNLKLNRMGRPNKGRNTIVGQMIRNRLADEKMKRKGSIRRMKGASASNVTSACIRGSTIQCRRRSPKPTSNSFLMSLIKAG